MHRREVATHHPWAYLRRCPLPHQDGAITSDLLLRLFCQWLAFPGSIPPDSSHGRILHRSSSPSHPQRATSTDPGLLVIAQEPSKVPRLATLRDLLAPATTSVLIASFVLFGSPVASRIASTFQREDQCLEHRPS